MNILIEPSVEGINSVLILIFVISAMSYFLFTARGVTSSGSTGNNLLKGIMNLGQYVLMGAFGAGFAGSFIGRLAVFIDVLGNVLTFFLKLFGI